MLSNVTVVVVLIFSKANHSDFVLHWKLNSTMFLVVLVDGAGCHIINDLLWIECVSRSPSKPLVRRLMSGLDWETVSRNSLSDDRLETQSLPNRSPPDSPDQWVHTNTNLPTYPGSSNLWVSTHLHSLSF